MTLTHGLRALGIVVAALLLASSARAQTAPVQTAPPTVQVTRVADTPPSIDGRLDDAAWQGASWVSDFRQKEPEEGALATQRTEVAFLYDGDALYVGARMHSADPSTINTGMTRRDEPGSSERLIVSLDTYHDRRTSYAFAVTAAGVRLDHYLPEDADYYGNRDYTFNPVWDAATEVNAEGWTAEMRIPFSQLRFDNVAQQVWGLNINRYIPALNEDDFLVVIPRDQTVWASRFAEMVGIEGITPTRRIEVVPYVASEARVTSDALVNADDPFDDGSDLGARAGLDFKMGLGPNLTLDATINPDFGQVEADPAEVNLSAFETFFGERRPFFTEGSQNFQGQGPAFFYSRRIGASPHGLAEGDFTFVPNTTTILGAAKVTGQLKSGLSVGALAALTDNERAETYDLETRVFDKIDVEPRTAYSVVRLQQQFGANASTVGGTLTGVRRGIDDGDPLAARLTRQAYSGGVDWNRRFTDGWYEIAGHVGFSYVEGDSLVISRLQRNSARFFQRPDQDYVEFDPSRTSLGGWAATLRGGKRTGRWRWNHGLAFESPGFEINDAGRLGSADDIDAWAGINYRQTTPGPVFRDWVVGPFTNHNFNFGGTRTYSNVGLIAEATLVNFTRGFVETAVRPRSQSDNATRGGPLMQTPRDAYVALGVFSNRNKSTNFGSRTLYSRDELGGWEWRIDPEFRTQPTDRLTLSFQPRYIRSTGSRQFITARGGGPAATFGGRYVFSFIDRSEIALPVRANYSFTPDLSLELYAEPFAASGRYYDIGQLRQAESFDLVTFGEEGTTLTRNASGDYTVTDGAESFTIGNPDFDVLSFRSNLVMRWEWRPGSALFVVWQQNRSEFAAAGKQVRPGDLFESLTTDGDNILAVKFTYWMGF
ncbi:MAG: DUF5916 domain-containing protein [Gemmatimonadota bacterium]